MWAIGDRGICAATTMLAIMLLTVRPRPRFSRIAWFSLIAMGIANALLLNLQPTNLIHGNLAHYFLGAKYAVSYEDFYSLVNAGLERPQINMRDLRDPDRMFRGDEREQRAYFIDLMRGEGLTVDPLVPLADLERQAQSSGAVARESERILEAHLPTSAIDNFRFDVRTAQHALGTRQLVTDAGFNGSPFYVLVRHLDPTLYQPLGRATAWLNLLWQMLAVGMIAWLAGTALGLDTDGRLAIAAFVFASWDFVGWAMPGLVFAGLWLPVAAALYAMRRRRPALAGVGVAWAGLIKLFPFVLALPAVARLSTLGMRKFRGLESQGYYRPWTAMLLSCAAAVLLLGFLAEIGARSWLSFFTKIYHQFSAQGIALNNVSFSRMLATLGIDASPVTTIVSLATVVALTAMLAQGKDKDARVRLPRHTLVLVAAIGWVMHKWLNYYFVAFWILLPLLTRRHRAGACIAGTAMALAYSLPEFNAPILDRYPMLHTLKLAPYVIIPGWLVSLEFSWASRRLRRAALIAGVVLLVAICVEAWRMNTVAASSDRAAGCLRQGDSAGALKHYHNAARLSPRNDAARMGMGVARAIQGDLRGAANDLKRAVQLNPDNMDARFNYARLLQGLGNGDEAARQLEIVYRARPYDEKVLIALARERVAEMRRDEAIALVFRARELAPTNEEVAAAIRALERQ